MNTETEQALADAKHEIETAVTAAAKKLRDRTGLLARIKIINIDTSTHAESSLVYVAELTFVYGPQ